jgi:hypothetical protein
MRDRLVTRYSPAKKKVKKKKEDAETRPCSNIIWGHVAHSRALEDKEALDSPEAVMSNS